MNGGSRIVDLRGRAHEEAGTPVAEEAAVRPPVGLRIAAGLVVVLALGWIGGVVALGLPALRGADPLAWATVAIAAAIVPVLLGVLWIALTHNTAMQARRFGGTARTLRLEAQGLEQRLAQMLDRIGESRAALTSQTNALIAASEGAATRLTDVGSAMDEQAGSIERSAGRLGEASDGAMAKLDRIVVELPLAEARAAQIGNALAEGASVAAARAEALEVQYAALAEHGRNARATADGAAETLRERIAAIIEATEQASGRIGESEAVADRIAERIAGYDEVARTMAAETAAAAEDLASRLDTIQRQATERNSTLATSLATLEASAQAMNEALRTGDADAHTLVSSAEHALTALDAVARELDETLPAALQRLDGHIANSRDIVAASKPELLSLVTAAQSTNEALASIVDVIADQNKTLRQLAGDIQDMLEDSRDKTNDLTVTVDQTLERTQKFLGEAAPQLVEALLRVRETANSAADRAREALGVVIPEAASMLEAQSTAALKRAAALSVDRQVAALGEAAEIAVETAQRASDRLTRQLLTIADTTAAVEARIDEARTESRQRGEESLARRSGQLLETLNSAAIDITGAIGADVADTAWAAYLKGDRGVFTRRAVRLLDNGEARDVAQLYGSDTGFAEAVNRYIHDFEAMLRAVLAQPDGASLSVTLLSSDLGKLYVALAQAIDRLKG